MLRTDALQANTAHALSMPDVNSTTTTHIRARTHTHPSEKLHITWRPVYQQTTCSSDMQEH